MPGFARSEIGDLRSLAGGSFTETLSSPLSVWLEAADRAQLEALVTAAGEKLAEAGLW
jgi:hypothetical protein